MGLIRAIGSAVSGVLADQWKEYFYCEALPQTVIMTKGRKVISGRSSNTKGNDNIISNGSGIVVADGQCMIIVDNGRVVEVCAEPGQFTYDKSSEPSIFFGSLGENIKNTFKVLWQRVGYGGDTGHDQRVYYFNTKELIDNKFGTMNPIPFRAVDRNIGLDVDVSLRCSGVYSYKVADPLLFYTNVCGNVETEYTRDQIDPQLRTEFISALQPAIGKLSAMEMRPNQIVAHTQDLEDAMNAELSKQWGEIRGLQIVSVAIGTITLPEEDQELIKMAQRNAMYRDPSMAAATLVGSQAAAMEAAANNSAGAMTGFMGFGMAANANGNNVQNLFQMAQGQQGQQPTQQQGLQGQQPGQQPMQQQTVQGQQPNPQMMQGVVYQQQAAPNGQAQNPQAQAGTWTCECGTVNTGNFCMNCGKPRPKSNGQQPQA